MKNLNIIAAIFLILVLCSCSKDKFDLNDETVIVFGQSKDLLLSKSEIISIKFDDLIEDSRCPPNVNCIWAGECVFTLLVNVKDKLTFGFPDDEFPSSLKYGKYKISIINVSYNNDDNFGVKEYCTVKLKVE